MKAITVGNRAARNNSKPTTVLHGEEPQAGGMSRLSNEQLGEILIQLSEAAKEGGILFENKGGQSTRELKKNYFYSSTCMMEDQMVNTAHLSKIHKVGQLLTLNKNMGSSRISHKGYLGFHLFWLDCFGISSVVSLNFLE